MTNNLRPFHLAIPVADIMKAHDFYTDTLGCEVGRQSKKWIDFNFFGHQLVAHAVSIKENIGPSNLVEGEDVPSRHFGIIMQMSDWKALVEKLKEKEINFFIKPQIRFRGKTGEQATFFILDPFKNVIEFKAFKDDQKIFLV